jgi:hypothetical protein
MDVKPFKQTKTWQTAPSERAPREQQPAKLTALSEVLLCVQLQSTDRPNAYIYLFLVKNRANCTSLIFSLTVPPNLPRTFSSIVSYSNLNWLSVTSLCMLCSSHWSCPFTPKLLPSMVRTVIDLFCRLGLEVPPRSCPSLPWAHEQEGRSVEVR